MFFDEFYSELYNESTAIRNFDKDSDMMVVIGTSLQTGLSRELVESAIERGVPVIEINVECEIKRPGTMWMQGKADEILDKIKLELWKTGL
jgi:NAD-dependent SIR2 family protein deacetylase